VNLPYLVEVTDLALKLGTVPKSPNIDTKNQCLELGKLNEMVKTPMMEQLEELLQRHC
jgi:hypothetical protein